MPQQLFRFGSVGEHKVAVVEGSGPIGPQGERLILPVEPCQSSVYGGFGNAAPYVEDDIGC